jgi:hypothetical protein
MAEGKKDRGFVLGDISPLAGIATGRGLTSNLNPMRLAANLKSGNMRGMGGEEEEEAVAVKKGPGMKSGGKVGSSCMKSGGKVGGDMPFFASKAKDKMASKKKPARKPMTNYASGGMVKADGCAMKGKTRGREC